MTDFEKELIHYIFHVQDADDDNLSAEVICRKLYKYGLIDRGRGYWRPKKRPRYRWPARIIRKAEQTEPRDCDTCKHKYEEWNSEACDGCVMANNDELNDKNNYEPNTDCSWK